jgi:hypothetical protein
MAAARGQSKSPPTQKSKRDPEPAAAAPAPAQPLKPRPVLFAVLCVVFALWMVFLIVLYFTTIHPVDRT